MQIFLLRYITVSICAEWTEELLNYAWKIILNDMNVNIGTTIITPIITPAINTHHYYKQ